MLFNSLFSSINMRRCFIFIDKQANGNVILFFIFYAVFLWTGKFLTLELYAFKFFYNFSIKISNIYWIFFAGIKYLTNQHLRHSLTSFWILTNPLTELFSSLQNWKCELPSPKAISEIISWWLNIVLITHPEPSSVHLSALAESLGVIH